jgi:hypothetical protein
MAERDNSRQQSAHAARKPWLGTPHPISSLLLAEIACILDEAQGILDRSFWSFYSSKSVDGGTANETHIRM